MPSGIPVFFAAVIIASATIAEVPGCAGCPLKITGQPEAKAEAVSPPATEKASGKLLAPKTATGPMGMSICLISDFGTGIRSGIAVSILASTQDPSRTTEAKRFN